MRMTRGRLLIILTLLTLVLPLSTQAQSSTSQYFPETGHSVSGRFLEYWRGNGGLAVFGYPLTDELEENGRKVQYFERQRFELHSENKRPYDVLLGRLGVEVLQASGIDWRTEPTVSGAAQGCAYFAQTRHSVCNQQSGVGFLNYWQTHGLEFDGRQGKSYAESLALFGYPITQPVQTTVEGKTVQVQWFERARFEWHPDNPTAYKVLLGRLGASILETQPPPAGTVNRVNIYLIALDDNGRSGPRIGCNDSVIAVTRDITPTTAPLTAALTTLLNVRSQYYGESGLYNSLYQSDLQITRVAVEQGRATIELSGTLRLGGTCDNPRVMAQLSETARQFSTVQDVAIFVNGKRLEDLLSER